jgi:hypothetical protein
LSAVAPEQSAGQSSAVPTQEPEFSVQTLQELVAQAVTPLQVIEMPQESSSSLNKQ